MEKGEIIFASLITTAAILAAVLFTYISTSAPKDLHKNAVSVL